MSGRIVVFGATGYTGRLTVAELVHRGARPVVAGRHRAELEELAETQGGLEVAEADASSTRSVAELVERGDVLLTTVGPFMLRGRSALDAAMLRRSHYVDSTGEAAFIRAVFDEHERAVAADQVLLTACGFDYVPGLLAGARALEAAGEEARSVDVVYRGLGDAGMSSGTSATGALMLEEPTHVLRDGRLVKRPPMDDVLEFDDDDSAQRAVVVGGTEPLVLPRLYPALTDCAVHLDLGRAVPLATAASKALRPLLGLPLVGGGLRSVLHRRAETTGRGPDADARAGTQAVALAIARDDSGAELARSRLVTLNPYDLTASVLAWSAMRLAAGEFTGPGALSPLDAFGLDDLASIFEDFGAL